MSANNNDVAEISQSRLLANADTVEICFHDIHQQEKFSEMCFLKYHLLGSGLLAFRRGIHGSCGHTASSAPCLE